MVFGKGPAHAFLLHAKMAWCIQHLGTRNRKDCLVRPVRGMTSYSFGTSCIVVARKGEKVIYPTASTIGLVTSVSLNLW